MSNTDKGEWGYKESSPATDPLARLSAYLAKVGAKERLANRRPIPDGGTEEQATVAINLCRTDLPRLVRLLRAAVEVIKTHRLAGEDRSVTLIWDAQRAFDTTLQSILGEEQG